MPLQQIAIITTVFLGLFAAPAGQNAGPNLQRLSVPTRSWSVEISLPNFTIKQNALSADGRARRLDAYIDSEGYVVTVNIVPASTPKVSSKDLRDLAAERLKIDTAVKGDGFRVSEYKQTPTFEYFAREFKTELLNQKHFYAYVSRDNIWIDIHLSKTPYREGDEKVFHSILDSIKFTGGR